MAQYEYNLLRFHFLYSYLFFFSWINSNSPRRENNILGDNQEWQHTLADILSILIMLHWNLSELQTYTIVKECVPSADPCLAAHVVWRGERQRKVFLIASRVRGSGSSITHDQVRVVFGELLAGYLSWLSIPLLGLGPCVGMIRSWRLGAGARRAGGEERRKEERWLM